MRSKCSFFAVKVFNLCGLTVQSCAEYSPDDSIPSTGNFSDWNSAVALGGTVILGKENNAEFIRGLQTGYLSVVLFHIDQESGLGIFCNSELTDIIGFEDAVMTAESLTK